MSRIAQRLKLVDITIFVQSAVPCPCEASAAMSAVLYLLSRYLLSLYLSMSALAVKIATENVKTRDEEMRRVTAE